MRHRYRRDRPHPERRDPPREHGPHLRLRRDRQDLDLYRIPNPRGHQRGEQPLPERHRAHGQAPPERDPVRLLRRPSGPTGEVAVPRPAEDVREAWHRQGGPRLRPDAAPRGHDREPGGGTEDQTPRPGLRDLRLLSDPRTREDPRLPAPPGDRPEREGLHDLAGLRDPLVRRGVFAMGRRRGPRGRRDRDGKPGTPWRPPPYVANREDARHDPQPREVRPGPDHVRGAAGALAQGRECGGRWVRAAGRPEARRSSAPCPNRPRFRWAWRRTNTSTRSRA